MKKYFVYSEEQENEMNIEMGYTQAQLDKVGWNTQYQWGLKELFNLVYFFFKGKTCEVCSKKLKCVKECTYVGLRHAVGATGGSYEKTYEVKYKVYCPDCQNAIFDQSE